jgi:hypothetical protein
MQEGVLISYHYASMTEHRRRATALMHLCIFSCLSICRGQAEQPADPYRLEWKRDFSILAGIVPVGAATEGGALWLIARSGPGKNEELSKIDPEGQLSGTFSPRLPLNPIEWVDYLSPAASGDRVGLLANVISGGRYQTHEGAFFVPVEAGGLGSARRIAGRDGPQFPHLIGDGVGQFIAVGDQEPLTLLKLDATGAQQWRRSFSSKLVLSEVSVGADGNIFVLSQGGNYILLQLLDKTGRLLRSKRIAAKQGTVAANADGGYSILLSKRNGGKENRVYLTSLSETLGESKEIETPLRGRGGRTYQLISTPRGHVVIGEGAEQQQQILAEFDRLGKPIWQQMIPGSFTPLLVPFKAGFYVVTPLAEVKGTRVEKYIY